MRKLVMIMILLALVAIDSSAIACVGKTIFVGHLEGKNEEIVGNVVARLVTERTGTSVKVKKFANAQALLQAGISGDIDLFVFSERDVRDTAKIDDRDKAKQEFNQKHNLVWLKVVSGEKESPLTPIIRKDTLKKFPALPKLLDKLNGLLTSQRISDLSSQYDKKGIQKTVKDFLKEQRLI